ncbi:MAG: RluA family pseudouridine synthase [Planctomycetota bacterium]
MTPDILRAKIPPEMHGHRLDKAVVALLGEGYSRSRLSGWIRDGQVAIDGETSKKPGFPVQEGQELTLSLPRMEIPEPGSALDPGVVYQDEYLAVLDKPAGLPMHGNSPGDPQMSVAHWLVDRFGPNLPIGQGAERPGIVHRLDRGTSGACVVAFDREVFEDLQGQFAERTVEKEYRALCYGKPRFRSDWIERRLRADPRAPNRVVATNSHESGTRDALTYWEVSEEFDGYVLLSVKPKTGRKHQIRVHLTDAGLPLVGDPFYRAKNYGVGMLPEGCPHPDRTLLHAYGLAFDHPHHGRMEFEAPYPPLYEEILEALRRECPVTD